MKTLICIALLALASCTATQQQQLEDVLFKVADVTAQVAVVATTVEEIKESEEGGFTGEGGIADALVAAATAAGVVATSVAATNANRDKKRMKRGENV
jgi:hypothetical protein